jgi:mono/diheme cytochrome c family protein
VRRRTERDADMLLFMATCGVWQVSAAALALFMLFGCTDNPSTSTTHADVPFSRTTTDEVDSASGPQTQSGASLFKMLCVSCHDVDGPRRTEAFGLPVRGLWGTHVAQTDGRTLLVDEQFIRESILEPHAMITSGCVPVMPRFKGQLSDQELKAMVLLYRSKADAAPVDSR